MKDSDRGEVRDTECETPPPLPTNASNQFKALGTHTGGHLPRFRTDLCAIARTGTRHHVRELHWRHEYDIIAVCIQGCATGSKICMKLIRWIQHRSGNVFEIRTVSRIHVLISILFRTSQCKELQKLLFKHFPFFREKNTLRC
jgi:hypothetical protein